MIIIIIKLKTKNEINTIIILMKKTIQKRYHTPTPLLFSKKVN